MRIGWRLGVILMLFTAVAVVLHTAPPVKGAVNPVLLYGFPTTLGRWSGVDGVAEDVLPPDPNERAWVRRTYRDGNRVAWLSVALFPGHDEEARRASINRIYPQRSVSLIEPVSFSAVLNGPGARPMTLPTVIVHQDSRRLLVVYWHQIGRRAYGGEYRFRLALMRDLIFKRRADALLVRIALPARGASQVAEDLATLTELAPSVYAALDQEFVK